MMNFFIKRLINQKPKIFCISYQRTGTTSTGQFFKDHGYDVATWKVSRKNDWTVNWFKGDLEAIFKSKDFIRNQVFEDDPWWLMEFYKILFHRFPESRYILLERNADRWFNSMVSHSDGKSLGNTHRHAVIYQREREFYEKNVGLENAYTSKIDNLLDLNEGLRDHYKQIYLNRNREIKLFFKIHDESRLFNAQLEDSGLWRKMGDYFGIRVKEDYSIHLNKSVSN